MEMPRQNPDQLLRAIRNDTESEKRGKLKIFFGYAAGVGKTYAMLQAAHLAKANGADVVAGYIEPHSRPQTSALLEGLEQIPAKQVFYGEMTLREFDIDSALKRKPRLILVDELAHTNAEGSRHAKRYQDVQELLNAGIDVYTTVNVQHIESLNDTVASITGIWVRERIPDSVFDQADQVELVDIEPTELLERMASGNIYQEEQAERAAAGFFTVENLTALREIALRRCADRVNLLTESTRIQNRGDYHTDEHILVCLSSSPSNAKIIRTAARMARAFRGNFTALFVETAATAEMSEDDKKRLRDNIRLAGQLGAHIETVYGEDVPYQIAEFARLSGVSKIVIGRSTATRKSIFSKPTLTEHLIANAPNLDIHVIPDTGSGTVCQKHRNKMFHVTAMPVRDLVKSILVLLASTLVGYVFYTMGFSEANIVSVYIFGVLVISVITTSRFCGAIASIVSVLVFNFFFTVPRFTFRFSNPNYLVTFPIMFMVALLTGSLATRLKDNAKQSANAAYRTKILFETNQLLQRETDEQAVIEATAGQLLKLLRKDIVVYLANGQELDSPSIFRTPDSNQCELISENEKAVAAWVLRNNKHAGATTNTLSSAKCLYLAIRVGRQVYGVVGIAMNEIPLDSFENSVLLSILGECALALENIKNAREKEEAAILARNEQLRANLLRAISHDLRTPLTSISGNADNLLANYQKMDDATRKRTFTDIYDDSMWLINLVENLLAITRIEGGQVHLTQTVELMDEVVSEALRHINRKSKEHIIHVSSSEELILASIDAKLIVQVIINLLDNAIKYTPPGSVIEIHTEKNKESHQVVVSVSDDGPGIPDDQKPHIFDMFYSGANKIADSRRSLGLGLSLCKSIVTAHGGTIWVTDHDPKGTVFTFTLPAGEVELHE
ncbi:MAG: ATP-binding protein [Marvinbryantia sp.]|uniref:sensor histidine kinase n=1 Tax=Marvinbryantia sp. TaxID=2496532 RepID=UPI0025DCD59E|nr:sensor histidine kinase KdpD [uncultured Marvinbryantia sp.]